MAERGAAERFLTLGCWRISKLGYALVTMGDNAAPRKPYQNFLTHWKDADPDIPIYNQANVEYGCAEKALSR